MQKIVDLKNTIGILKPYSNFESFIVYLVVNAFKKNGELEELCQNKYT